MEFWLFALAISFPVAGALILALVRARPKARNSKELEIAFLASQIGEIDKDVSRGALNERDAESSRIEVSRRLLNVDRSHVSSLQESRPPKLATAILSILVGVVLVPGAIYVHSMIGVPDAPDMPLMERLASAESIRANRLTQAEFAEQVGVREPGDSGVDPKYLELMEQLRKAVAEDPESVRGLELLVQHESALGRFSAAADAKARIVDLKGASANADDFADLAELMIFAVGGYVSPEAEQLLGSAIKIDPKHHVATYYTGLMYTQTGRPDRAFRLWSEILESSSADPELVAGIRGQITAVARLAGIEIRSPPLEFEGPDEGDIAGAAVLTDEERSSLILGMVQGLEERLFNSGGSPEEWARLIRSLDVLGESERALTAWVEANELFKDDENALQTIAVEAEKAGLAE